MPTALAPRERPTTLSGKTHRVRTGHGTMYLTVNIDERGDLFEVFAPIGKNGGCHGAAMEAVTRFVSLSLRVGVDLEYIIAQLQGITCCPLISDGVETRSPQDGIAKILMQYRKPAASPETAADA